MNFFETKRPYEIADKVTSNNELAPDLVAHVFEIMHQKDDIEDQAKFFSRTCYQQWNWHNSEFNRMYKPVWTVEYHATTIDPDENPIIHQDQYSKYLHEYFSKQPNTVQEWFCREIAYLRVVEDMTYLQIEEETGIAYRYVSEAIKQFKDDLLNSYNSSSDTTDTK